MQERAYEKYVAQRTAVEGVAAAQRNEFRATAEAALDSARAAFAAETAAYKADTLRLEQALQGTSRLEATAERRHLALESSSMSSHSAISELQLASARQFSVIESGASVSQLEIGELRAALESHQQALQNADARIQQPVDTVARQEACEARDSFRQCEATYAAAIVASSAAGPSASYQIPLQQLAARVTQTGQELRGEITACRARFDRAVESYRTIETTVTEHERRLTLTQGALDSCRADVGSAIARLETRLDRAPSPTSAPLTAVTQEQLLDAEERMAELIGDCETRTGASLRSSFHRLSARVNAISPVTRASDPDDALLWWLSERQCDSGGLNGRSEKQADVCYSWWILSSLSILGDLKCFV